MFNNIFVTVSIIENNFFYLILDHNDLKHNFLQVKNLKKSDLFPADDRGGKSEKGFIDGTCDVGSRSGGVVKETGRHITAT